MSKITSENIHLFNQNLRYEEPKEIISFVLEFAERPLVTTSFGPFSAVILHAVTSIEGTIKVIWCDTGYNTDDTYRHAKELMELFGLNIEIFTPKYTTAYLNNTLGRPHIDNPKHGSFSEKVKLEPFKRALNTHQPDVWFTNLRKGQTAHRDSLDILSFTEDGTLKVSPFFYHDDEALSQYMESFNLPAEFNYFDPVKALENRECGIHLRN
jgi:phosphoadenosine phosphosulfate reductase